MEKLTTLVMGASLNSERYSNMAIRLLHKKGKQVKAIGTKKGNISGIDIDTDPILFDDIHTVTLYLSPANQKKYYNYIIELNPIRIIFNPGTENDELRSIAQTAGIETEYACTLVLLNLNQY